MSRGIVRAVCVSLGLTLGCGTQAPVVINLDPFTVAILTIDASVDAVDPDTGLPTSLSGTISGDFSGTYSETILEIYFDSDGNAVGAYSLSQFQFDAPRIGTFVASTHTAILAPILGADPDGEPIPVGFTTAAEGTITTGTGEFDSVFGGFQTESELLFTGGDSDLGQASVALTLQYEE